MTQAEKITKWLNGQRRGKPFSAKGLHRLANRGMVDQTLSSLAKAGKIKRLLGGIYVKPKFHDVLGEMTVPTSEAIRAIASHNNELICSSGADAANRLGLSTQVPVTPTFLTSGRTRKIKVDGQTIRFRQVHRKFLEVPGLAGEIVRALRYLGKEGVTEIELRELRRRLTPEAMKELERHQTRLPHWMSNIITGLRKSLEFL